MRHWAMGLIRRLRATVVKGYFEGFSTVRTATDADVDDGQALADSRGRSGSRGGARSESGPAEPESRAELSAVMCPDFADSNPYQRELCDALDSHGVSVELSEYGQWLPLLGAVWGHERRRPDVVHLHWLSKCFVTGQSVVTALFGVRLLVELAVLRLLGVRTVWTVHNLTEHERQSPRVERGVKRLAGGLFDNLVVHCETAADALVEAFSLSPAQREKVAAIPHGHYLDSYPDEITRADARASLGYEGETVFLFFGLIRPYKNVGALIEAFRGIDDPDARLLVVGNPLDDDLGATVRQRVSTDDRARAVLEFVPDAEVQRYMNAADVVVLPYENAFTSGAAVLAMSFGRPVVAPNVGCVGEILDPAGSICYEPDDPDGLSRSLRAAFDADLDEMGANNRRRVERFDWSGIARATRRLYDAPDDPSNG
ncbi:MAG: glycosyltransferase [Haloarculaceae archaeon]